MWFTLSLVLSLELSFYSLSSLYLLFITLILPFILMFNEFFPKNLPTPATINGIGSALKNSTHTVQFLMEITGNNGLSALLSKQTCYKIIIMKIEKNDESIKGLFSIITHIFRFSPCILYHFTVSLMVATEGFCSEMHKEDLGQY